MKIASYLKAAASVVIVVGLLLAVAFWAVSGSDESSGRWMAKIKNGDWVGVDYAILDSDSSVTLDNEPRPVVLQMRGDGVVTVLNDTDVTIVVEEAKLEVVAADEAKVLIVSKAARVKFNAAGNAAVRVRAEAGTVDFEAHDDASVEIFTLKAKVKGLLFDLSSYHFATVGYDASSDVTRGNEIDIAEIRRREFAPFLWFLAVFACLFILCFIAGASRTRRNGNTGK